MSDPSGELRLHLERVLPAPPDRVFRMQSEPELLARWWGPTGFTTPRIELDVRVGGAYQIVMQPPEGDAFTLSGEYREVEAPTKLAYTFRWDPADPDDQDTTVTLTIRDLDGSTGLTVDQGIFATEPRRALHEQGWSESLDRLHGVITA